jgi:hypothetical protein
MYRKVPYISEILREILLRDLKRNVEVRRPSLTDQKISSGLEIMPLSTNASLNAFASV